MIDLHLHFDGSVLPSMARELMACGDDHREVTDDQLNDLLVAGAGCRDLNEYLAKFDFPLSLLQTAEQIEACVYLLRQELKSRGIDYAELRFAPQSLCQRGLSQRAAVEAAIAGLGGEGAPASLILCCMRGQGNEAANRATVELAAAYLGKGVCAADLAGAEALFPTSAYRAVFSLARELKVPFTIHAGEAAGPQSIWDALSFGAARIGHGVRAVEDPRLVEELAERHIPLELCPTSEINTCIFETYRDIPLRQLMDAGVTVTLNSDNMAVSDTDVAQEFAHMQSALALSPAEVAQLHRNAEASRFMV